MRKRGPAAPDPEIIAELEAELRILRALYSTSLDVFEEGQADAEVRGGFRRMGYGQWSLANVYSFVYERSMEIEPGLSVSLLLERHPGQFDGKTLIVWSKPLAVRERLSGFCPALQVRQRDAIAIVQIGSVARRLL